MEKVFDRKGRLAGYLKGNSVFDNRHRTVGYIQDNILFNTNFTPVAFVANEAIYNMEGIPLAYLDGRTVRDLQGSRLGRVSRSWYGLLSAGLLLGRANISEPASYYGNGYQRSYEGGYRSGVPFGGSSGSIGATIKRFLFGNSMSGGYGNYGPDGAFGDSYRQNEQMYEGYYSNHHKPRSRDRNKRGSQSRRHGSHREERYYQGDYKSRNYEGDNRYYEQDGYEGFESNNPGFHNQNSYGREKSGIGTLLLNNLQPIASVVGRYMMNKYGLGGLGSLSGLGDLGNLAGMVNLGGLGNAANAGDAAGLGGAANLSNLENLGPLINAMSSMLGGMGANGGETQ